jgi:feruloyl-CoA synthase
MTSTVADLTELPFREPGFRKPSVDIERRPDGTLIVQSGKFLPAVKSCTTDWLEHWARVRPNNPMLAQRDANGDWISWSVSEVWNAVRSIASALLWHGGGTTSPLVILSEN